MCFFVAPLRSANYFLKSRIKNFIAHPPHIITKYTNYPNKKLLICIKVVNVALDHETSETT